MAGHIKLDRKILEWEWYQDANTCRLFIHLLLVANYKESKWRGHKVCRGQLITGLLKLNEDTGLSISQIRTSFSKLKMTGEITIRVTNKFSIITICKYDDYQSFKDENDKQNSSQIDNELANQSQTNDKQIATSNKNKNYKEVKEVNTRGDVFKDFSFPVELKFYWGEWVEYKKKQHKFAYKDIKYEASAVRELLKISEDKLPVAIEIIRQSISNGWKGLFPLKAPAKTQNNVDKNDPTQVHINLR